jgi:hypothetical protein
MENSIVWSRSDFAALLGLYGTAKEAGSPDGLRWGTRMNFTGCRRFVYTVNLRVPQALTDVEPLVFVADSCHMALRGRDAGAIESKAHAHFLATEDWTEGLREEVVTAARRLQIPIGLSIRSSATLEDLPEQSFAGQYRTFSV